MFCKKCGTKQNEDDKFCRKCGNPCPPSNNDKNIQFTNNTVSNNKILSPHVTNNNKCLECGHIISSKAQMCPNCGCPITPLRKTIVCPECKNRVFEGINCSECGYPFQPIKICPECHAQVDGMRSMCNICGYPF